MNKHFFIIVLLFIINWQTSCSQTNELFNEYLSNEFIQMSLSDELVPFSTVLDTFTQEQIIYEKYKYKQFLSKELGDTGIIPCAFFKSNSHYVTIFLHIAENINTSFDYNGVYYYFIIYNSKGEIKEHYNLFAGRDEMEYGDGINYSSKLFLSKSKIKYLLYGPYKTEMEANCMEVLYEINDNGGLEKLSEKNYTAKKKDEWNW